MKATQVEKRTTRRVWISKFGASLIRMAKLKCNGLAWGTANAYASFIGRGGYGRNASVAPISLAQTCVPKVCK